MIIKRIKDIQEKPEDEKTKIVWALAIFFMIIIIGGWVSSFKNTKKELSNDFNQIVLPSFVDIESKMSDLDMTIRSVDDIKSEIISENERHQIEEIAKKYITENHSENIYNNLNLTQIKKIDNDWKLEYQQLYQDILIEKNTISLTIDNSDETVRSFVSTYDKEIVIDTIPDVKIEEAQGLIAAELNYDKIEFKDSGLVIYKNIVKSPTEYHLTWKIQVVSRPFYDDYYYVDAKSANIVYHYSLNK